MRILLVEDDVLIRNALVRRLRREHDAEFLVAESVSEAIAHLEAASVDVILCDYDLVGSRNGGDLLAWIRATLPQLERRFAFLSANEAVAEYGVPWLPKPCEAREVVETVARLVRP